eukprot:m.45840 g.45840  ORF g.45840 m.45840 type:complete len:373 (+) comp10302_c0_seq1:193-1311(+)
MSLGVVFQRVSRTLQTWRSISTIPKALQGDFVWVGKDLENNRHDWELTLTQQMITNLEEAAAHCKATKNIENSSDLPIITPKDFPVSQDLKDILRHVHHKLLHGRGVQVFRGLPIHHYDISTAAIIFCGIGAHLGHARSQNAAGHILGHVRDKGVSSSDPNVRIYQTSERQTFHTDSADAVGLLCLKEAQSGGDSLLVSAAAVYNKMNEKYPDLLPFLFDERIATDRRGEIPPNQNPYMEIPPFSWYMNKLTVFYQRQYIDSAQRFPGVFQLTDKHVEALDKFDELCNDSEIHYKMTLNPGDIQFVYNHNLLHDRTSFKNSAEKERHLLRLWLSLPQDRELPTCFIQRYGDITIGNRGGVNVGGSLVAPLFD